MKSQSIIEKMLETVLHQSHSIQLRFGWLNALTFNVFSEHSVLIDTKMQLIDFTDQIQIKCVCIVRKL